MDTLDAIYKRRSVKHYDPDHVMPEEDIKKLFEAAIQSPSSFNLQNWRFVAVNDKEQQKKLRAAAFDQAQVEEASLLVVMTAHLKAHTLDPNRYWVNAPKEVQDMIVPWMGQFYEGREDLQRDEALRSIGIAAQTIMLTAKSMDYDSCPMIGFEMDKVAEIINLPEDHAIGMFIAIGKGVKDPWPKPGQLPLDEVLIRNSF